MSKIFVCCLIFVLSSTFFAQQSKEEKLQQLKNRKDVKVTEVEKDILKLEYPNGKVLYKNIRDYQYPESDIQQQVYSPNYDSTIIDLATIDTTLYYQKYKFWQEVPLGNFRTLLVGDVNNNGRPELYGQMKAYTGPYSDIVAYEMNAQGGFSFAHKYDSNTVMARSIIDIDKDSKEELHLIKNAVDTTLQAYVNTFLFYSKNIDSSLATNLAFIFDPIDSSTQQNDNYFGDWDGDALTDQIFYTLNQHINIYEYDPYIPNFDSVFQFDHSMIDLYYGGFSIGDFDQDGKTEFLAGSVHGKVLSIENCGDNCYAPNWQGMVETYNAYLCAETNDIDGNSKKEIWIGGDAFYSGQGITRITIFEANGDNSYEVVGRIDLLGIFSFDAGNIQVIDVDKDGQEEVLFGLDMTVLILKFNGSLNHHTYEVFYYKQHSWETNYMGYYGANLYNLIDDEREELLINMWDDPPGLGSIKWFNWIYKPDFTVQVESEEDILPGSYNIFPAYPNPFNPNTNIKFDVFEASHTTMKVFNVLGKEITTLLDKEMSPGSYSINWEAKDSNGKLLPAGVYLIRFRANNYTKTIKTILLK
ncbi:MAG: T9SS type A sorting domain-containing protein [Ignavibacterium sp.]|jgi:hypothetical protein|nr:T9SS type A sorting domain-containing protein [Ignavibacterium sp.]